MQAHLLEQPLRLCIHLSLLLGGELRLQRLTRCCWVCS
jgi:hypothetical protein